jgi:hypothetical protein
LHLAVRAVRRKLQIKAWTAEMVPAGEEKDISHKPWFGDEPTKKLISALQTRTTIL